MNLARQPSLLERCIRVILVANKKLCYGSWSDLVGGALHGVLKHWVHVVVLDAKIINGHILESCKGAIGKQDVHVHATRPKKGRI